MMGKTKTLFCLMFAIIFLVSFVSGESGFSCFDDNLNLIIEDIFVSGFSVVEDKWYPLDFVEVEVEVENKGEEDLEDVQLNWCLYDDLNKECVMEGVSEEFDLSDNEGEVVFIDFLVDIEDLEENVEDYTFFVKASGEVADGEFEGDELCDADSLDVKVVIEDDFVILDNVRVSSSVLVLVGDNITFRANVWNIGGDDQDDVSVRVYNNELGIDRTVLIGDIASFDYGIFDENFVLSENIEPGTYQFVFEVIDEDNNVYENDNGAEARFFLNVDIKGRVDVELIEPILEEPILESESVSLILETEEDVVCSYDLYEVTYPQPFNSEYYELIINDGEFDETGGTHHEALIENLEEGKEYEITSKCETALLYGRGEDVRFVVDLDGADNNKLRIEVISEIKFYRDVVLGHGEEIDFTPYLYEGEVIRFDVQVYSPAGIDKIAKWNEERDKVSVTVDGEIEVSCLQKEIIDDKNVIYDCHLTIETPSSMQGLSFLEAEVETIYGEKSIVEIGTWFLNPVLDFDFNDDLIYFNNASPGVKVYSEPFVLINNAEKGSQAVFDIYLTGSNFNSCISLGDISYYVENDIYTTLSDSRADEEGYISIMPGKSWDSSKPLIMEDGFSIKEGEEMLIKFRIDVPEDCVGEFDSGTFYFWGNGRGAYFGKSIGYQLHSKIDTNSPSITLINPKDNYATKTSSRSKTINFEYRVSDESSIQSCELFVNGELKAMTSSVGKDTVNSFSVNLDRDDYTWQIKCKDSANNEGVSEIIDFEIQKKSSSSGSSNKNDRIDYTYLESPSIKLDNDNLYNQVETQLTQETTKLNEISKRKVLFDLPDLKDNDKVFVFLLITLTFCIFITLLVVLHLRSILL